MGNLLSSWSSSSKNHRDEKTPKLKSVDDDDDIRTYRTIIAGVKVTISKPSRASDIRGITFLLPGSMIAETEYDEICRRVLVVEQRQVVISMFMNVLLYSHERLAERVKNVFDHFQLPNSVIAGEDRGDSLPESNASSKYLHYNIVGHSVGAKVGLLLACQVDPARVKTVVALDPVDILPVQFTNDDFPNLDFASHCTNATIYLTFADSTSPKSIPPRHNAAQIYRYNQKWMDQQQQHSLSPNTNSFPFYIVHSHASHLMAYTDHGGGFPSKYLIRRTTNDTPQGNAAARHNVQALLKQAIVQ